MQRKATFLLMAVLVAFPAWGWAQDAATTNFSTGNGAASVQGYGNQTATYNTGCVQIESYEKGTIDRVEVVVTGQYTNLGSQSGVPCSPCGTDLGQGEFEVNTTTTKTASEYTALTKATHLVGIANMTSLGGMSLCTTAGISAEGSLGQTQTIDQNASGNLCPGVTGSASYTGTQTFTANIKSQ